MSTIDYTVQAQHCLFTLRASIPGELYDLATKAVATALKFSYEQGVKDASRIRYCDYPNCDCPISFPEGHKPSRATECPRTEGALNGTGNQT